MPERPPVACIIPGCGSYASEHGRCAAHQQAPVQPELRRHTEHEKYHHLYNSTRWKKPGSGLRACQLRKAPLCADPFKIKCHRPATVADHILDHHGDPVLFFDPKNLQSLCAQCHNTKTAQEHDKSGKNVDKRPALVDGRIVEYGG